MNHILRSDALGRGYASSLILGQDMLQKNADAYLEQAQASGRSYGLEPTIQSVKPQQPM